MTRRVFRNWGSVCFAPPADGPAAGNSGNSGNSRATQSELPDATQLRSTTGVIECLGSLPKELDRLVAGKSRETLMQPDNDGGWGVVEIVSHLLDWEKVNHDRVHRLLRDDEPDFEVFDDSLWAVEHNNRSNDPARVLAELKDHRQALVDELQQLEPADWERTGILGTTGPISLQGLMNKVCDHDVKHLQQVRDALA